MRFSGPPDSLGRCDSAGMRALQTTVISSRSRLVLRQLNARLTARAAHGEEVTLAVLSPQYRVASRLYASSTRAKGAEPPSPPSPPSDIVLALKRVKVLRDRCTQIATALEEGGAMTSDLAEELNAWREEDELGAAGLVDVEKEAARLRGLADDLAGALRDAEIMAEHGELKC